MNYLLGDIQGCGDALDRLLATIDFSPSRDLLYVLGDLVNRGPKSLETLRRLRGFGEAAVCLLGNHDMNLLAVAAGVRRPHKGDTIDDILGAPDRDAWLDWLRHRRLAFDAHGWLMVHAGIVPSWDRAKTMALAAEIEVLLRSDALGEFLPQMYGDEPVRWNDALAGVERWRFIINTLTRVRYVAADDTLDLVTKEADGVGVPEGYRPWFEWPERRTADTPVAFGHWASMGLVDRPTVLGLDTGCVWGRQLSCARIDGMDREIIQVECGA